MWLDSARKPPNEGERGERMCHPSCFGAPAPYHNLPPGVTLTELDCITSSRRRYLPRGAAANRLLPLRSGMQDKLRTGSLGPELARRGLHPVPPPTTAPTGRGSSLDFHPGLQHLHQHQHQRQQLHGSWGGPAGLSGGVCPDPTAPPLPPPGGLAQPLLSLGAYAGASGSAVPGAGAWAAYPAGSAPGSGGMAAAALAGSRSVTPVDGGSGWGWAAAAGPQALASRSATSSGTAASGGGVPGLPLGMMAALGPTPSQRSASPQLTEPRRGAGTGQGYGLDGLNSEGGSEHGTLLPADASGAWGGATAGAAAFATGRGGLGAASSSMETLPSTGSGAVLPPRPRVAAAHTAASRNHQRAPRRAISTVGLMAEELRASGATPLERAANAAAASATAVGLGLGLSQGPSHAAAGSRVGSPGPGQQHPHPHPSGNAHALAPSPHGVSNPHPHHRQPAAQGHGHGDHQNHSQAPHTAQPGASHSRFANLSRPASRTAAAATATTVLGSNSSLSPPDSPRGQFAPLTQGSFGAGDGAYGTVPTSSPIPSVPYYTAAAPPPPSYNAVLLPILATPSELNAFVETAVGSGRADGALGISMSLGGGSSSRSGSPAPGRHAAYVHPHTHGQGQGQGQMGRLSFGDGYSHDGAGAGGGAGAHMGHMSEVLEAVLQQRRPPSSLDRAAGAAAAAAEGSDLSSPAAHMPLSLRRDLSGEDDPGLVLPYDDSGTSNVYGSLGRGRAPYTDCSASPSPAGTARSDGAGAGGAVAGIWPLASGSMVVSSGTAAVNSSFGGAAAVARDAATLLSERKAAVRAACSSSLSGMSTLPGGIPGARSSASATATGSGMGAGMGAGGEPTAGWPGGRWSRAGTPAGDDGAGAGNTRVSCDLSKGSRAAVVLPPLHGLSFLQHRPCNFPVTSLQALSSAPHDSLSIAAETAAAAAVAALSGVSTNGSLGGGGGPNDAASAEWISYTRTRASAVGPTPLAAPAVHPHHCGSRVSSPGPQAMAGGRGSSGTGSSLSGGAGAGAASVARLAAVAEGLGATAAVISSAQQEAAASGVLPPSILGLPPAPAPPRSAACFSSDCGSAAAGGGATAYGSSNKALRPTSTMLRTSSCAVASCAAACGLTRDPAPAGGVPLGAARSNTHIGFVTSAPLSTVQAQALPARASGTASLSSSWSRSSCERASPVQAAQLQQQQLVSDGGFGGAGSASAVELLPSQGVADEEEADAEVARLMMGASGVAAATATITATATSPSTGGAAAPTALAPAPAEPLEGPWPAEVTSAWRDRSPMPDSLATAAAATAGAAARTATATATGRRSDTPLLSLSRAQWRPSGTASGDSRPATGTGLVPTLGGCAAPSPDPVAVSSRASVPLPLPSRAVSSPHMMVIASSTSAVSSAQTATATATAATAAAAGGTAATAGAPTAGPAATAARATSSTTSASSAAATAMPVSAATAAPAAPSATASAPASVAAGTSSTPMGQRGAGGVVINFTHATAATITTSPSTNGISASAGSSIRPTSTTGLSVYGAHAAAAGGAGATPATTSVTSSRPASVTGFSTVGCSSFSGTGSLPSRPTSVLGMSYSGAAGSRPVSRLGAHTGVTASGAEARAAPPRSRTSLAMRPHDKEVRPELCARWPGPGRRYGGNHGCACWGRG